MKALDIIARIPHRSCKSRDEFQRRVHRAIREAGHKPVRAQYNQAGNCTICGEAGRCPGWHLSTETEHAAATCREGGET
ncbi:MAG: hypothetical protein MUC33_02920 [Desulfobacterales bacterium]|jgi:hypothetical protein|nr:hypothetical protein [Desulfobacterales bacterium]